MTHKNFARAAQLALAAVLALTAFGCSKKGGIHSLIPNDRPSVDLTAAPIDSRDTTFYAYRLNWTGNDDDGRVAFYQYAIDPPGGANSDTVWTQTTKNEQIVFFRATKPYHARVDWRSTDFHTFVIRAVDNLGANSAPKARSFYSYTIAPTVNIINPAPSALGSALVTPAVRITWLGVDPDGQFSQKPVKYKYKLLRAGDPEFDLNFAKSNPDSLRNYYMKSNFAGWDSVGAETTTVQYTGLTPNAEYLFIVIGYDEAGAFSPDFSLYGNILDMVVGFAGTLGPTFTVFNEFITYTYASGGFTPNDPLSWINLELPAGQLITFNWFATPPAGAAIEWYRWRLDGDVTDEVARTNEDTDWYHWSQKSNLTTSCTIGPFPGGAEHFLYIEAQDNNGLLSLATIHFKAVSPTFSNDLLIVDDTRREVDKPVDALQSRFFRYTEAWPSAAELDTFLYARGGVPWRKTQNPTPQPYSKPGVFAGYSYDTLGTRQGYEIPTSGVPLSLLGKYKHIIWMVDDKGATNLGGATSTVNPLSTLHFMCSPRQVNTLAAYVVAGGKIWLLGGAAGYASLVEFNARGSKDNDRLYGVSQRVFSSSSAELVPGRIMFDAAHWQSEFVADLLPTTVIKSSAARGGWSNPGWKFQGIISSPDYSSLPLQMRERSEALGDSLPPTRASSQRNQYFFAGSSVPVEYLSQPNAIIEDIDPSPSHITELSVLDTLMELQGGSLATLQTGQIPATMTYYHGTQAPEFIFSGFDIWRWTKSDCIAMADFVLQQIWHLTRNNVPRGATMATQAQRPGMLPAHPTLSQQAMRARLPVGKTRE